MRFELNPTMALTKEEHEILDKALKLCRDLDEATTYDPYEDEMPSGCDICPKRGDCTLMANDCVFTIAHKTLKEIIDMAVIK